MIRKGIRFCLDYVEMFFIPALSVILPWPVAFRLYKVLSRLHLLYAKNMETIFYEASKRGLVQLSKKDWIAACKLGYMIDYADIFLCATRGKKFAQKYVVFDDVNFIQSGVGFFPHYGMGLWLYRVRAIHGQKTYLLANRPAKGYSATTAISYLRLWVLKNCCNTKVIAPNQLIYVKNIIRDKGLILVAPDIPYHPRIDSYFIETKLGKFNVAAGFFQLVTKYNLKTVGIIMGQDGLIHQIQYKALTTKDARLVADQFVQMLISEIQKESYLWRAMVTAPEIIKE